MKHSRNSKQTQSKNGTFEDGITVKKTYKVKLKDSHGMLAGMFLFRFFMIFISTLSIVMSFSTGLELTLPFLMIVGSVFGMSIFVFMEFLFVQGLLVTLPTTLLVYVLFLYELKEELLQGVYHIENACIRLYNWNMNTRIFSFIVEEKDGSKAILLLVLVCAFLISGLIAYVIVMGRGKWLYLLICMGVLVIPCWVGKLPHPIWLGMHVICTVTVVIMTSVQGMSLRQLEEKYSEHKFYQQMVVSIGTVCFFLFLCLWGIATLWLTNPKYESIENKNLKVKLQKQLKEFDMQEAKETVRKYFKKDPISGGLSGGDLYRSRQEIKFNHSKQLTIDTPQYEDSLYLKGYVGTTYEGEKWGGLTKKEKEQYETLFESQEEYSSSMQLMNLIGVFLKYNIPIRTKTDIRMSELSVNYDVANRNYLYAPYNTVFHQEAQGYRIEEPYIKTIGKKDGYELFYYDIKLNEKNLYELRQYVNMILDKKDVTLDYSSKRVKAFIEELEQYMELENKYRSFAYEVYTKLPKEGLERIKKEYGTINLNEYNDHTFESTGREKLTEFIKNLKTYFAHNTTYSLKTDKVPKGQDYIEYFLYESKKGYCSHYASAATVILRAMGVPARYVEGYSVSSTAFNQGVNSGAVVVGSYENGKMNYKTVSKKTVTVEDTTAHAWVEVYLDQLGWYPIEFTPGGYVGEADRNTTEQKPSIAPPTPTPTIMEEEQKKKEQEEKEKQQKEEQTKKKEAIDKSTKKENKKVQASNRKKLPTWVKTIVLVIITVLLLIVALTLRYLYKIGLQGESFKKHRNRDKAVYLYEEAEKLLYRYREDMIDKQEDQVRSLYLKAMYAPIDLTNEEYKIVRENIKQLVEECLKAVPKHTYYWLKYGRCFYICHTKLL